LTAGDPPCCIYNMAARTGGGSTPNRAVRVPTDVWVAAKAEAKRRGETVSAAVVRFLRDYINGEKS
jgi:hypothetical protein